MAVRGHLKFQLRPNIKHLLSWLHIQKPTLLQGSKLKSRLPSTPISYFWRLLLWYLFWLLSIKASFSLIQHFESFYRKFACFSSQQFSQTEFNVHWHMWKMTDRYLSTAYLVIWFIAEHGCTDAPTSTTVYSHCLSDSAGASLSFSKPVSQQHTRRGRGSIGQRTAASFCSAGENYLGSASSSPYMNRSHYVLTVLLGLNVWPRCFNAYFTLLCIRSKCQ